jgi:hypothetical protein
MFSNIRKWLLSGFGVVLIGKGAMTHQWLTAVIGAGIIAYAIPIPG